MFCISSKLRVGIEFCVTEAARKRLFECRRRSMRRIAYAITTGAVMSNPSDLHLKPITTLK